MKLDNFYYSEYLDYCLHLHYYIHYVSADAFFSLLKMLPVTLLQDTWHKQLYTHDDINNNNNNNTGGLYCLYNTNRFIPFSLIQTDLFLSPFSPW